MAELADVLEEILSQYPHKSDLSNARVTKLVYLADWVHCIREGTQISRIRWIFDNFGPFVWDVVRAAEADPERFSIDRSKNCYGTLKKMLKLRAPKGANLSESERSAIRHVIQQTSGLSWSGFIQLVYSTHPIMASERYSHLDLQSLASDYQAASG